MEFKSQLSFVSPSVATTPCGFLASSFSWTQSPWSPGLSPQGGYGLRSLCTHLAMEREDRDAEVREALARWSDDQKLKKGHDINRHGECFWCKNRVKGIHPGVPQTQKATGVAPSWGWVNWSGPRGSAKRGHGVCLLLTGPRGVRPLGQRRGGQAWGSTLWGRSLSWWGDGWTSRRSGAVGQYERAPRAVTRGGQCAPARAGVGAAG